MGWGFESKHKIFLRPGFMLAYEYFIDNEDAFIGGITDQLKCLAYLLAKAVCFEGVMTQYIAGMALNKGPRSFGTSMAFGSIEAQQEFVGQDFFIAYVFADTVNKNDALIFGMKLEA